MCFKKAHKKYTDNPISLSHVSQKPILRWVREWFQNVAARRSQLWKQATSCGPPKFAWFSLYPNQLQRKLDVSFWSNSNSVPRYHRMDRAILIVMLTPRKILILPLDTIACQSTFAITFQQGWLIRLLSLAEVDVFLPTTCPLLWPNNFQPRWFLALGSST